MARSGYESGGDAYNGGTGGGGGDTFEVKVNALDVTPEFLEAKLLDSPTLSWSVVDKGGGVLALQGTAASGISPTTNLMHLTTSGSDSNDGLSPEFPVQTIAQARTNVIAQTPGINNQWVIICEDASIFTVPGGIDLPEYVSLWAPLARIESAGILLNRGSNLRLHEWIGNQADSGITCGNTGQDDDISFVWVDYASVQGLFFQLTDTRDVLLKYGKVITQHAAPATSVIIGSSNGSKILLDGGKIYSDDSGVFDFIGIDLKAGEIIGEFQEIIFVYGSLLDQATGTALSNTAAPTASLSAKMDLRLGRTYTGVGLATNNGSYTNLIGGEFLPDSQHVTASGADEINISCTKLNPAISLWTGNPAASVNISAPNALQVNTNDQYSKSLENAFIAGSNISLAVVNSGAPNGNQIEISGSGGGASVNAEYRYSNDTTMADPTNGRFRLNNSDPALADQIAVSDFTNGGIDFSALLNKLSAGDTLYIQNSGDSSQAGLYTVTGSPVDNGTWFQIPVSADDAQGAPWSNNAVFSWLLLFSGGGGSAGNPGFINTCRLRSITQGGGGLNLSNQYIGMGIRPNFDITVQDMVTYFDQASATAEVAFAFYNEDRTTLLEQTPFVPGPSAAGYLTISLNNPLSLLQNTIYYMVIFGFNNLRVPFGNALNVSAEPKLNIFGSFTYPTLPASLAGAASDQRFAFLVADQV